MPFFACSFSYQDLSFTLYFILKSFVVFINDGEAVFFAEFIALITDWVVASLVGLIALARYHIDIIEDDMVVDMPFINVG